MPTCARLEKGHSGMYIRYCNGECLCIADFYSSFVYEGKHLQTGDTVALKKLLIYKESSGVGRLC